MDKVSSRASCIRAGRCARPLVRVVAIAVGVLLASRPSGAEPAAAPFSLRVEDPTGCVTSAAVASRVREISRRSQTGADTRLEAVVRVTTAGDGVGASVALLSPLGKDERTLRGARCAELGDAVAWVIALALDPERAHEASREAPPPALVVAPPAPASPARSTDMGADSAVVAPSRTRYAVGASVLADTALLGQATPVASVFAVRAWPSSGWAPAVRASFEAASTGITDTEAAATYARYVLRLSGCPVTVRASPHVELRPCAGLGGGVIRGAAHDPVLAYSDGATRGWLDATLLGHAQVGLGPLFAELSAGAVVPFYRPTFVYTNPRIELRATPPLALLAGAGVGVRLP